MKRDLLILTLLFLVMIPTAASQSFVSTESIDHSNSNIGEIRIHEPYHETTTVKIKNNEITKLELVVDTIDSNEKYFLIEESAADVFSNQGNLSISLNGKEIEYRKETFISKEWIKMNLTQKENTVVIEPKELTSSSRDSIIGWIKLQIFENPIALFIGAISIVFIIGGAISYRGSKSKLEYKK